MADWKVESRAYNEQSSHLIEAPDRISKEYVRSTDGDVVCEPAWDEMLTITVGQRHCDLVGDNDRVLQAAVDYMSRLGGGTVDVGPGVYTLRNAIHLPSRVRIRGSGEESVITKAPSATVALVANSDWYDQEITLEDAREFQVGDAILLRAKNPAHGNIEVIKRILVARSGNRFKLNDGIRENLWLSGEPTASLLFPLLTSENSSGIVIENIALDGDRENNENLDGNYGGCIFLQDCNRVTIRDVIARNYNGDGISFQVCHDVVIEDCHCHDNTDLGIHPGSGSQRPRILNNCMERNRIGLFWCWGVKFGLAEGNRIEGNFDYGISIGHNDTDNVMRDNTISHSGKVGILFRDEDKRKEFSPHRNVLEKNRVYNSGDENGVAIDIRGPVRDLRIVDNDIAELREPLKRIGIRIGPTAGDVTLSDNVIRGFGHTIIDERTRSVA